MDQAVAALSEAAGAADSSNTCRLTSEAAGFEETEFEASTRSLIQDRIRPALRRHPDWMSPPRLESLLRSILALQPAVKGYRGRLLSECGDYGNELSPLAAVLAGLVAGIEAALAVQPSGMAVLDSLPAEILDAGLRLFLVGEEGRLEADSRPLREHLRRGR
jgi:hypothetical protein